MSASKYRAQGFTLVEILIVVVILGILAAIVIPQFTSASESAKASSLTSQLQTIRSQLELYQVQHGGEYPTLAADADWDKMVKITDKDGTEYDTKADVPANTSDFGPYLQQPPSNPFTGDDSVKADNTGAWKYNDSTGKLQAVIPADKWTELYDLGLGTEADEALTENADVVKGAE